MMSFPKFIIEPSSLPVTTGGFQIGPLKWLWSKKKSLMPYWRPTEVGRVVFRWRGVELVLYASAGLVFIEATTTWYKCMVAVYSKKWMLCKHRHHSEFLRAERLQCMYDTCHRSVTSRQDGAQA